MDADKLQIENLKKIEHLNNLANAMETFFRNFRHETSKGQCDKHAAGFMSGGDDMRWPVFLLPENIKFCAHVGYFGNSSCSTFSNYLNNSCAPFIMRVINAKAEEIFKAAAILIRDDANKILKAAARELSALETMLDKTKKKMEEPTG